jgi:hypothetical protein
MDLNGVELQQLDSADSRVEAWLARGSYATNTRRNRKPEATTTVQEVQAVSELPEVQDTPVAQDASSAENASPAQDPDGQSGGGQLNSLSTEMRGVLLNMLSLALFLSVFEVVSIAPAIPVISSQLNTGISTSWIGSSFLVAMTAFQLINGRLNDAFGHRNCLPMFLILMSMGNIGCGFSWDKASLFGFRAVAGVGGGGVTSMLMIIAAEFATVETRGKWQCQCRDFW